MRRLLLVVVVGIAALALLAPAASARGTVTLPAEACVNLVEHLQGLQTPLRFWLRTLVKGAKTP
jgi:hypothetical protein